MLSFITATLSTLGVPEMENGISGHRKAQTPIFFPEIFCKVSDDARVLGRSTILNFILSLVY